MRAWNFIEREMLLMQTAINRRGFLATSTLAAAGVIAGRPVLAAGNAETPAKTTLKKALIAEPGPRLAATLKKWKAAGIEGMEAAHEPAWRKTPAEAAAFRKIAEREGMRIHSVMFGWANVNDPAKVTGDIENMTTAIGAAKGYGADAVLVVPCRVNESAAMPIPKPWEFDIRFDEKTGHLRQVVAGDNAKYAKYVEAQDYATDATKKAIAKLIPVAEKARVIIALENVWNNLWVTPAVFANLVESFNSPWVNAYYDFANGLVYAPAEEWLRTLGRLIVKIHIKDFRLGPDGHGGQFVDIRTGSIRWPSARAELAKIGYNGWLTLEGSGRLPLAEQNRRLDLIIAGK
jgi:L-ribulose-5-phosphate 3-epimerase